MSNYVAFLWDLQNVHPSIEQVCCVDSFAKEIGTVVRKYKFVYGHWSGSQEKWEPIFDELNFTCINAPASKAKPNHADEMMIDTGLEYILNNPTISTVILLSKDRDFVPLVQKLKAAGKKVILVTDSEEKTSRALKKMVGEFFYTLSQIETQFTLLKVAA